MARPLASADHSWGLAETDEHIDSEVATADGPARRVRIRPHLALTVGIMSLMGAAGRATPDQTPATLADRLERGRRRRFVGRAAELELFHGALDARDEAFAVLFVHGPGGVGKSALLAEYARTARAVGRRPVSVDGHEVTPTPAGFRAALAQSLGVPADAEVADALHADTHVVLVDTFERLAPLEGWVRDRFLPTLPAGVVVVVAGRRPPTPAWLADAGWRDLLRVVSLRNLSPEGTREYLELEGFPAAVHAQVVALTHGHPLALSLLVDARAARGTLAGSRARSPTRPTSSLPCSPGSSTRRRGRATSWRSLVRGAPNRTTACERHSRLLASC